VARLLFIGMWNFCDDNGVHPGSFKRLRMEVFPGDSLNETDMDGLMGELIEGGLVRSYEVEGKLYWQVTGWKHQRIDKPTNRYPLPIEQDKHRDLFPDSQTAPKTLSDDSSTIPRTLAEPSSTEGKGGEGKVREVETEMEGEGTDGSGSESGPTDRRLGEGRGVGKGPEQKTERVAEVSPSSSVEEGSASVRGMVDESSESVLEEFVRLWKTAGFTMAVFTNRRKQILSERISTDEFWKHHWRACIERIGKSKFCTGINERGWVADVDWFLKPDTVAKIVEGAYDGSKQIAEDNSEKERETQERLNREQQAKFRKDKANRDTGGHSLSMKDEMNAKINKAGLTNDR